MAVYTTLTAGEIQTHLARYDIGALVSHHGISEGVENTNYLIETTQGTFILTLFEKRVDKNALPFYLGFMAALQRADIPTAAVVTARDGHATHLLAGKTALLTHFLHGQWQRRPTPAQAYQVGHMLARMHMVGRTLKQERVNAMSLPAWISLITACGARADEVHAGLALELQHALDAARTETFKGLPEGVIHADLFPDNVFFDESDTISGVIDFYFSCRDHLAYDLMLTLNAWCFTSSGDIDGERAAAFFKGYQSLRSLEESEYIALPALGRAAALRIIATRLYDWLHPAHGALVRPKDPMEHVRILRYHAQFASGADYPWLASDNGTPA